MKRLEALNAATARLAGVSDTPRLDAEILMAHATGISREALLLGGLAGDTPDVFEGLVCRRLSHEPVAYITGSKDFWTITLDVAPGVLIPRPDSETLIAAAVEHFRIAPKRILDLGTGPGTLLLAALDQWPDATGLGIDSSEGALLIARANAERIAPGRAEIRPGDWAGGLDERFDLVLCNPPYIEAGAALPPGVADHEPPSALFAGADGLDDYRRIIPQLPALVAPGGMIAVEIGHTQALPVSALFEAAGLRVEIRNDLGGRNRAVIHFALGIGAQPV